MVRERRSRQRGAPFCKFGIYWVQQSRTEVDRNTHRWCVFLSNLASDALTRVRRTSSRVQRAEQVQSLVFGNQAEVQQSLGGYVN